MGDLYVVIDVNLVVDKMLLDAGSPRRPAAETISLWDAFGTKVAGSVWRPVLSRHIVATAQHVLEVNYPAVSKSLVAASFAGLTDLLEVCSGFFDPTTEDYAALTKAAFRNGGTDAEDEAVLATALRLVRMFDRSKVAVATRDTDFTSYLADRKVQTIAAAAPALR
jgi:hypothetical protein